MSDQAFRNFVSVEGTITGTETIPFEKKSRHIMLMNDSDSINLCFRFSTAEAFGTLYPGESLTLNLTEEKIILNSSAEVPYRLWAFG